MSKGDPPEVGGVALEEARCDIDNCSARRPYLGRDAIVTTAVQREVYLVRRESRGMVREQGGTRALAWGVEDQ